MIEQIIESDVRRVYAISRIQLLASIIVVFAVIFVLISISTYKEFIDQHTDERIHQFLQRDYFPKRDVIIDQI